MAAGAAVDDTSGLPPDPADGPDANPAGYREPRSVPS